MHNLQNPPWRHNRRQTRVGEIDKCLVEGLEPIYYFSSFDKALTKQLITLLSWHLIKCARCKHQKGNKIALE